MMTIRCPRCAEELQPQASFCGRCGLPISQAPTDAAGGPRESTPTRTPLAVATVPAPQAPALKTEKPEEEAESENERLLIFSDAVVSFAITIAAIPLRVPKNLEQLQKGAFALELGLYLFGFLLIADLWRTHHAIFHHIKRNNGWLIVLNTLFLAMIVCVPVGFFIIFIGFGGNLANPSPDLSTLTEGALLFLGAQFCANLVLLLMWYSACARPAALFGARAPEQALRAYQTWKLVWHLLSFCRKYHKLA